MARARAWSSTPFGLDAENPMDSIWTAFPATPTTPSMVAPAFEMSRSVAVMELVT